MNEEMTRRMHFGGGDFDDNKMDVMMMIIPVDFDGKKERAQPRMAMTMTTTAIKTATKIQVWREEKRKKKSWTNSSRRVKCIKPRKQNNATTMKNFWINSTRILESSVKAVCYKARCEKQSVI